MPCTLKNAVALALAASSLLYPAAAIAADPAKNYPERPIRLVA